MCRSERLRESPTERITQKSSRRYKQLAQGRLIQKAIQPPRSPTILEEEERANQRKKTTKRSPMTPQTIQNPQNMHASTKSRKRELRPESSNSPYEIESWLTQLPHTINQNPWQAFRQDLLPGRGRTASRSRQHPFYGGNLKARIFLQQVDNKIADAAGASDGRRIQYVISLLGRSAAEWAATG